MEIDGFTYVRNGLRTGYPFIASIQSLLPIVNKLIVVVGNSDDGTREAIENLNNQKIVIIDSIWGEDKRKSGEIFREQSDIGINHINADWAIHLQADEVLKESARTEIIKYVKIANEITDVDGLLFPFHHFWGDFKHIRKTRRTHAFEIRAFKNHRNVHSYRDSQGFRKFELSIPDHKGTKLNVLKTNIPVYHYSYAKHPKFMNQKFTEFNRAYHSDHWLEKNALKADFDYNKVDRLEIFDGTHPSYMQKAIENRDWEFNYDPSKSNMRLKDKILYPIEKHFGYRLFEYKNYKLMRLPKKYR